jgi:hypothetical protein
VSDCAGNGNRGWVDGPAAAAEFMAPNGIAAGSDGRVSVAEYGVFRVRVVQPAGAVRRQRSRTTVRCATSSPTRSCTK